MRSSRVLAAALVLSLAAAAEAQNSTQQVTLTGAGARVPFNGVYVGPYTGSVPGMPTLDIFCVDYLNSISIGYEWTANFTSVSSILDDNTLLSRTRWGSYWGGSAISMYQQAAWLATQFAVNGTGAWGGIHGAIWDIFTPGDNPNWSSRLPWMSAAGTADLSNMNWDYWYVVSDVETSGLYGGTQEFMVYVTPEPETLILMGTGLVAVFGVAVLARRGA